jgi:hypothetical protein
MVVAFTVVRGSSPLGTSRAGGAAGAFVAKVALAALDLASIPKVALAAAVFVGVGRTGGDQGGDEAAGDT